MTTETPRETPPPTPAECARAAQLSTEELALIDAAIVNCSHPRWRKVARVMWDVEAMFGTRFPELTYRYYILRMEELVRAGRLESQGHLRYMRFSEIRQPTAAGGLNLRQSDGSRPDFP